MRIHRIVRWVAFAVYCASVTACAPAISGPRVPLNLIDFSLSQFWVRSTTLTDFEETSAVLSSFLMLVQPDGKIQLLMMEFQGLNAQGQPHAYTIWMGNEGQLNSQSIAIEALQAGIHPLLPFKAVEQVSLVGLIYPGEQLHMKIQSISGDLSYSEDYTQYSLLQDGELLPLHHVSFHSQEPWVEIFVCSRPVPIVDDHGYASQPVTPPVGAFNPCQIWFLPRDLDKMTDEDSLLPPATPVADDPATTFPPGS
jgi:hypothetical protein